jgi:hypothetical protein
MYGLRLARPLTVGSVAVLLAVVAGCPSSTEKSGSQARSSQAKQQQSEEPTPIKPPVDEFQQPPVLPASEPPPKLTEESPIESKPASAPVTAQPAPRIGGTATVGPKDTLPPTPRAKPSTKVRRRPATAKNSGEKFDPIKVNGAIFKDWPKPKAAIAITGMERGYIEPCGCAGLEWMKGGMSRRYSLFKELRENRGWPLVALDLGGMAHGRNAEAEIKFRTLAESKSAKKMGYAAIGFGAEDLMLSPSELVLAAGEADGKPSPFISANVGLFGFNQHVTQTSRVVEAGGTRVGVTAILGKQFMKEVEKALTDKSQIEMIDPETALKKIVPDLKRNSDYMVLLANATREEAVELARKFPEFDAVVASDDSDMPLDRMERVDKSKTLLITVGRKGMYVVVLGLYDDKDEPVRYQRVALDSRFPPSKEMKQLMANFQEQLKAMGFKELGLRPVPHPLAEQNGRFVGSKKCESCHEKSYEIWKKSGHSKAYETLVDLDPPRQFDPECVSCHVVGWHPTKFFPYVGGFMSAKETPRMLNVGCEDCHGPGENHVRAELGSNEELQKRYRKAVVITKEQSKKEQCISCHDGDNSPDFNFDLYWPLVEHYERAEE